MRTEKARTERGVRETCVKSLSIANIIVFEISLFHFDIHNDICLHTSCIATGDHLTFVRVDCTVYTLRCLLTRGVQSAERKALGGAAYSVFINMSYGQWACRGLRILFTYQSVHFWKISQLIVLLGNHFCLLRDILTGIFVKTFIPLILIPYFVDVRLSKHRNRNRSGLFIPFLPLPPTKKRRRRRRRSKKNCHTSCGIMRYTRFS